MNRLVQYVKDTIRKADLILLLLCLVTTAFGIPRYIIVQCAAAALGILLFFTVSAVDADFLSEHRSWMVAFNCILLALLIPFGTDNNTTNRSWLDFPFLPVQIQPAEICKITFILIMASVMASHQNSPSSPKSVLHMAFHLLLLAGVNMLISEDLGVTLIFVFIFIGMAYSGGVNLLWFLGVAGIVVLAFPFLWNFLSTYQQNRILIIFDETIDPNGFNERYHMVQSLKSLTGGGMTGQGLFQGTRTQRGSLYAQHTDYIFSAIGEELGYLGCVLTVILIVVIIARCIQVGTRSPDYMRRMICFGAASALVFQVCSNIGMCLGVTPVIGLTLPFISYGGSSLVSLYAMMGLVSGVHARPSPTSHERYIRPPLNAKL